MDLNGADEGPRPVRDFPAVTGPGSSSPTIRRRIRRKADPDPAASGPEPKRINRME
jgi:hypothetical protein